MKASLIKNQCWESERDTYRGIVPLYWIQWNKQFPFIVYRGIFYVPVLYCILWNFIQGNFLYRGIILKNVAIVHYIKLEMIQYALLACRQI